MTETTPARAALDELDALLTAATPGPWRWEPNFGDTEDSGLALTKIVGAYNYHCCDFRIDPGVNDADAALIVALRNRAPAMLAAIRAAYALHVPVEWFEEVEPGAEVFDPTKPLGSFCRECTDDEYVETVEGGYAIDQGSPVIAWPCPTVTALDEALGVAK